MAVSSLKLHSIETDVMLSVSNRVFASLQQLYDHNGQRKYLTPSERDAFLKAADAASREVRTQTDTAGPLVQTFIKQTGVEPFFDAMLMTTAVLRNKLSASHGAGAQTKQVPRHEALYALNVRAAPFCS